MTSNNNSPLRYPGGKSILSEYFTRYIEHNKLASPIYAEPYCGGSGAAVNLMLAGHVTKILLNDADPALHAFWYSLKYHGDDFLKKFDTTSISIEEWEKQKQVFKNGDKEDLLSLGFATFFLNRSNRSGILKAGPIGGRKQLNESYKIDARFKRDPLRKKLLAIIQASEKIEVSNLDALSFLEDVVKSQTIINQQNTFVYLDPPYYSQGSSLYLNYYKDEDHVLLREYLNRKDNLFKWILSYDNAAEIRALYSRFDIFTFYINYSAQDSKLGSELLIPSRNSNLPPDGVIRHLSRSKKKIELKELSPSLSL